MSESIRLWPVRSNLFEHIHLRWCHPFETPHRSPKGRGLARPVDRNGGGVQWRCKVKCWRVLRVPAIDHFSAASSYDRAVKAAGPKFHWSVADVCLHASKVGNLDDYLIGARVLCCRCHLTCPPTHVMETEQAPCSEMKGHVVGDAESKRCPPADRVYKAHSRQVDVFHAHEGDVGLCDLPGQLKQMIEGAQRTKGLYEVGKNRLRLVGSLAAKERERGVALVSLYVGDKTRDGLRRRSRVLRWETFSKLGENLNACNLAGESGGLQEVCGLLKPIGSFFGFGLIQSLAPRLCALPNVPARKEHARQSDERHRRTDDAARPEPSRPSAPILRKAIVVGAQDKDGANCHPSKQYYRPKWRRVSHQISPRVLGNSSTFQSCPVKRCPP